MPVMPNRAPFSAYRWYPCDFSDNVGATTRAALR